MITPLGARGAPVGAVLDLRHPLAALALRPAFDFAAERGIPLDLVPLAAPGLKPPSEPREDDDRGVRHRRARARAIAREIGTYAAAQGLDLREPYRHGEVDAAHRAWLYVREHHPDRLPDFLRLLFRDYWATALDPADAEAVATRVEACGADGAGCRAWSAEAGAAAIEAHEEDLRVRGLDQVPLFVVGDEVFVGRQHFPMIGWILDGRTGPVPI